MGLAEQALRFHTDPPDSFEEQEERRGQSKDAWVLWCSWMRDTGFPHTMSAEVARASLADYERTWTPSQHERDVAEWVAAMQFDIEED